MIIPRKNVFPLRKTKIVFSMNIAILPGSDEETSEIEA